MRGSRRPGPDERAHSGTGRIWASGTRPTVALAIGVAAGTNGPSRHGGTEGHGLLQLTRLGARCDRQAATWQSVPQPLWDAGAAVTTRTGERPTTCHREACAET